MEGQRGCVAAGPGTQSSGGLGGKDSICHRTEPGSTHLHVGAVKSIS